MFAYFTSNLRKEYITDMCLLSLNEKKMHIHCLTIKFTQLPSQIKTIKSQEIKYGIVDGYCGVTNNNLKTRVPDKYRTLYQTRKPHHLLFPMPPIKPCQLPGMIYPDQVENTDTFACSHHTHTHGRIQMLAVTNCG